VKNAKRKLPRFRPARPGHVFSWDELQEINLLLGLLSESLAIDVDRAEKDLPEPDLDALEPTRANQARVNKMIHRIEQAAKQLKRQPRRGNSLTLREIEKLALFIDEMKSEMELLDHIDEEERAAKHHRQQARRAKRWLKILERAQQAKQNKAG